MKISFLLSTLLVIISYIILPSLVLISFLNKRKILKVLGIIYFFVFLLFLFVLVFSKVYVKDDFIYISFLESNSKWFSLYFEVANFSFSNLALNLIMLFPVSFFVYTQQEIFIEENFNKVYSNKKFKNNNLNSNQKITNNLKDKQVFIKLNLKNKNKINSFNLYKKNNKLSNKNIKFEGTILIKNSQNKKRLKNKNESKNNQLNYLNFKTNYFFNQINFEKLKIKTLKVTIILSLTISVLIEVFQFVLPIKRSTEILDVILNVLSSYIGYLFFTFCLNIIFKLYKKI